MRLRVLSFPLLSVVVAVVVLAVAATMIRRAFDVPIIDTSDKFDKRQVTGVPFDTYLRHHSEKLGVRPEDQVEP